MTEVITEVHGAVGWVRLNRPERGNSVTPEAITEVAHAVERFGGDSEVRAVVLTGTGNVFCAGADVQAMYTVHRTDGADALMDYLGQVWMPAVQRAVRTLWRCPKPIVAAVNGAATAGGLDFALACDMRIAAASARFAESYINLGMVPVAGGAFLLPWLVGPAAATELLSTGRLVEAEEAGALGLVDRVCDAQRLAGTAEELAASLARGPAATLAEGKRIARSVATSQLEAVLDASYQANVELIARGDVRDRIVEVMERYATVRRPRDHS